jgi:NAD(P)-dependent dehydrogenase (short-subunit alcohol dehydrogenase family)
MTPAIASALMPLMRSMDAETAHGIALRALSLGLAGQDRGADHPSLATEVAGLRFRNPLGLAAGFDKNAEAVLPLLRRSGDAETGGLIINVSSHAARNAFPDWGAYCASKAALQALSRCLAEEERPHGVRVCTLTLGSVNTPLWDSETVVSDFDRRAMLSADQAADALAQLEDGLGHRVVHEGIAAGGLDGFQPRGC